MGDHTGDYLFDARFWLRVAWAAAKDVAALLTRPVR